MLTALGARETVIRGTAADGLRAATDPNVGDPLVRLAEHCGPRRMLLVLDNCEHVVDAAARLAEYLLARCPGVTVLATSREPLAVPGSWSARSSRCRTRSRCGCSRTAGRRPARVPYGRRPGGLRGDLPPSGRAAAGDRAGGGAAPDDDPRQIADRLDDRFQLLTSGSRTVLPRQQTLRAVVDWSWDLLDERERTVLRRVAVFAGGWDLDAAEAVCADPEPGGPEAGTPEPVRVAARDIAAVLGSLVDKSLVVAAPTDEGRCGTGCWRPWGVHGGPAGRLRERQAVERRHLVAFRELARTADPRCAGRGSARGWRGWSGSTTTCARRCAAPSRRGGAGGAVPGAVPVLVLVPARPPRDSRHWSEAVAALAPISYEQLAEPAPELYVQPVDAPPPLPPDLLAEARRQVRLIVFASVETDLLAVRDPEAQRVLRALTVAYRPGCRRSAASRRPCGTW
ncbi:hypothetical protein NKH77_15195 [Streptomyces sp. M19]